MGTKVAWSQSFYEVFSAINENAYITASIATFFIFRNIG